MELLCFAGDEVKFSIKEYMDSNFGHNKRDYYWVKRDRRCLYYSGSPS